MTTVPTTAASARPLADRADTRADVRAAFGTAVIGGFGTAAAMWLAWFVTHLPAIRLAIGPSAFMLLGILALGTAATARLALVRRPALVAAGAGLVAALINLMLLGSKVVEQPAVDPTTLDPAASGVGQLVPHAAIVVGGFVVACIAIGGGAGLVAARLARRATGPTALSTPRHRLAAMAIVACCATAPLLFIGGLVTSTESGMAVPDWPGSFGANMFLYPIGLMAHPRIYLEHAHRLFGALVGLCTVATFVYGLFAAGKGRIGIKLAGFGLVMLVITQGVLGGVRVTEINLFYALFHGVTAQIFFACLVAFAAVVSPLYLHASPSEATRVAAAKARPWAIALIACLFLQLILGAAYRHQGHVHALYTHAAFAIVAVVVAVIGAFTLQRSSRDDAEGRSVHTISKWIIGAIAFQFVIGWAAFALVTQSGRDGAPPLHTELETAPPVPPLEALTATVHQANGALLLALATLATVLSLRFARRGTTSASAAAAQSA